MATSLVNILQNNNLHLGPYHISAFHFMGFSNQHVSAMTWSICACLFSSKSWETVILQSAGIE